MTVTKTVVVVVVVVKVVALDVSDDVFPLFVVVELRVGLPAPMLNVGDPGRLAATVAVFEADAVGAGKVAVGWTE